MKETGILFKDRLVRAILEDRKTQTRRIVKPALPDEFRPLAVERFNPVKVNRKGNEEPGPEVFGCYDEDIGRACPYGGPGDRLWVREAWRPAPIRPEDGPLFRSDNEYPGRGPWKPGIHLFRKDARILLHNLQVRIERLQDISEAEARAEGVEQSGNAWCGPNLLKKPRVHGTLVMREERRLYPTARTAFMHLWDSINGEREGASWAANPWVWAITFERVTP